MRLGTGELRSPIDMVGRVARQCRHLLACHAALDAVERRLPTDMVGTRLPASSLLAMRFGVSSTDMVGAPIRIVLFADHAALGAVARRLPIDMVGTRSSAPSPAAMRHSRLIH